MPNFPNNDDLETWGYIFIGSSAIDSLISNLEGKAVLDSYPEFGQRPERANQLISELFEQELCSVYVRRRGAGQNPGEEIWELIIATDQDGFELPARLNHLGKTLSFRAVVQLNGYGGLKILSARLLQPELGYADGYAAPFHLRLRSNYKYGINIPAAALARMAVMPVCGDHLPTEEQLKAWEAFLRIEEKFAQKRQFCVSYLRHNYGFDTRQITFDIDLATATLDGSNENSLDAEDFWQRVKLAKNEDIKLYETAPTRRNWRNSRQIGTITQFNPKDFTIQVKLERELADYMAADRYQLPANGFLFFEASGDIQQIQRKKKALNDLKNGRTQNPFLGNFFFDSSQARPVTKTVELRPEDLLLSSANSGQKAAVEMVLASDDLALIQGPPGTGKTTVIAEICYQVALRGGRTLITSQANLAVDNALSRLVHNPVIRAVRKGKAEKVGEEGQPFLEDRVIDTWLKNTSADCENNLNQRLDNAKTLSQLLAQLPRFTAYLKAEESFKEEQNLLQTRKANLELACSDQTIKYKQTAAQLQDLISLKTTLDHLLNQALSVDWQDPKFGNLWTELLLYTSTDSSVRDFAANISLAVDIASELGMERPKRDCFGLAAWLQNDVTFRISEVGKALTYASHTATAMTEADLSAQTYRKDSDSLARLKLNQQQLLDSQQSLQEKIRNLQKRKSQISLAKSELDKWSATDDTNISNILNNCLQERKDFKADLISLPSGLLTLTMTNQHLPWQQSLEQCQVKVNELIQQYRQWDRASSHIIDIKSLLLRGRNLLGNYLINEADVSHVTFNKQLDSLSLLIKLKQLAQNSIDQIEKPLRILDRIIEKVLVIAVKQKSLESLAKILRPYSRLYNAAVTLEAIKKQAQSTVKKIKPISSESEISQITREVIDGIVKNANIAINELQTKTEQEEKHIEEQLNKQMTLYANCQQQISDTQEKLVTSSSEAEFTFKRAIALLQELANFPQSPQEIKILSQQYLANPSNILMEITQFTAKIRAWENRRNQLDKLISLIDTFAVITNINHQLISRIAILESQIENHKQKLTEFQSQLKEIVIQIQQQLDYISTERNWWQLIWQTIPDNLKPEITDTDTNLLNLKFLHSIKNQFNSWELQLKTEADYLQRYQNFIQDWIAKLRTPSERDSNDLRRIYLDNANVVGITCVQAANFQFSQEFKFFDVVIIDEVSKCTPPELLIPALKGKKIVMVGDHRQLPPMLDTSTLEEVAEEIGSTREELKFLEESLFKIQFETADQSIKIMLNTQYRMHPNIMGVINQFYDGKLECGILEPDSKRAHNLAGKIIKPEHHLIWVKTPRQNEFQEERQRTSFFNIQEIDVIENICQQFENAWSSKVANSEPKKEIAVITFYGSQLRKIDERLRSELFPSLQIRTGTVDRFQGMERPVVIVSMVRNNHQGDVGFAKKPERVNVAFSRAQELLIIVGCHDLFTQKRGQIGSMYSNVSNIVRLNGGFVDVSCF